MKLANFKDKEKILKATRDKRFLTYMGRNIRLTTGLSTETWQAREGWHDIFNVLHEEHAAKNTLSSKAFIHNRRKDKKSFQDRKKLKEYVTTKPALQEILRGTL